MTLYERYRRLDLDFSRLGLEQGDTRGGYFCTPLGAEVIGWEGVDGIHYCFIEGFGEMVFAVNPAVLPGEYVHPLARSFEDFLRLLIACGSTAAVEQAWMWDRAQFDAFVMENPPVPEIGVLRDELFLTPMDDPYGYIREVHSSFDYGKIPFSDEYYDTLPPEYQAPEKPEWRVYFADGFGSHHVGHDRPGKEIPVNKTFTWGGNVWHIPAVYVCGKGLVVDLCMEIDPSALRAFMEKWEGTQDRRLTPEEMDQQMAENPTDVNYCIEATVNGRKIRRRSGNGFGWVPDSCRPESERGQNRQDWEAVWLMEHYGLDPERGWMFCRDSFEWSTKSKPTLKTLSLSLEQEKKAVPGPRFTVSGVGDTAAFINPITKETHILKVEEYEALEINTGHLPEEWDYPTRCTAMSYTVEPELPREALTVRDCAQGDTPRPKPPEEIAAIAAIGGVDGPAAACSVGIIGGADGPTSILLVNGKTGRPRAACSALRFDPPEKIEWRMVFYQKTVEGTTVGLLP